MRMIHNLAWNMEPTSIRINAPLRVSIEFGDRFDPVANMQFLTNVDDMRSHGGNTDVELAGDFLVEQSGGEQVKHFAFTWT